MSEFESDVKLSDEIFSNIENSAINELRPYDFKINEIDWDPGEFLVSSSEPSTTSDQSALEILLPGNQSNGDVGVRIRALEEEQESLLSSLMALTSHFAQVQFRLHQIVKAPETERDILLKKLEDFADRGIPECANVCDSRNILNKIDHQKNCQYELIEQLKNQLEDLEKYAYEAGEPVLPQSILLEKQKVIIDELKQKMNLNFNELDLPQLTTTELRTQVDQAIGEFVSPLKMKEQLVAQLKTQVIDLERFIKFLQGEKYEKKLLLKKQIMQSQKNLTGQSNNCDAIDPHDLTCDCNGSNVKKILNGKKTGNELETVARSTSSDSQTTNTSSSTFPKNPSAIRDVTLSGKLFNVFNKASTLLHIFTISQIGGCASPNDMRHQQQKFKKNILKKTDRGNHWGDIRAKLEVEMQEVLSLAMEMKRLTNEVRKINHHLDDDDDSSSDKKSTVLPKPIEQQKRSRCHSSSSTKPEVSLQLTTLKQSETFRALNIDLVTVVRKKLSITLQKLMQHGLRSVNETRNLIPFSSCFANFQLNHNVMASNDYYNVNDDDYCDYREMHAWELIVEYYKLKNGDNYNETPAQKLSQSYNLDIAGDVMVSNKQSLLYTIRNIINIHSPYKRSNNSHFKAFVCAGLNNHKLVQWLNLIFQCKELINTYYTSWSYVINTNFQDALKSLDQLTKYDFDLPIDLAIRQFQNIKDIFL